MTQIKVNSSEFERIAKRFDTAADNSTKIHSKIKTATTNLFSNWKGYGREAFEEEYDTLFNNMESYKEVLEGISEDIREIGLRFKETDDSLKNDFQKD